jgi:hypothetical protein
MLKEIRKQFYPTVRSLVGIFGGLMAIGNLQTGAHFLALFGAATAYVIFADPYYEWKGDE